MFNPDKLNNAKYFNEFANSHETNRITGLFLKVRRLSWSQFKDKAISKKLS